MITQAKLTDRQRREIRFKHAAGHASQRRLAAEYGVSKITIDRVLNPLAPWAKRRHEGSRSGVYRRLLSLRKDARRRGHSPPTMSGRELKHMVDTAQHCEICEQTFACDSEKCVDHCHNTGKVRGILCHGCNHLLGFAKDQKSILANAISYLGEAKQAIVSNLR